jgi:hypothetical protein
MAIVLARVWPASRRRNYVTGSGAVEGQYRGVRAEEAYQNMTSATAAPNQSNLRAEICHAKIRMRLWPMVALGHLTQPKVLRDQQRQRS